MITIASTIPAYASKYLESDIINVDGYKFNQLMDGGSDLLYVVCGLNDEGDDTFDKAELAVRVWYDGNSTHNFGMQTFTNANFCKYDDKGYYQQIAGVCNITKVKAWCRITKNGISKENCIYLYLD